MKLRDRLGLCAHVGCARLWDDEWEFRDLARGRYCRRHGRGLAEMFGARIVRSRR